MNSQASNYLLLVCPKCKEKIPSIQLIPFTSCSKPIKIQFKCHCQPWNFDMPLTQYLKQTNNKKSSNIDHQCSKHFLEKSSFCFTCNISICVKCINQHEKHQITSASNYFKQISKDFPFTSFNKFSNYVEKFLSSLTTHKNNLISRIDQEIQKYYLYKQTIEETYLNSIETNSLLIHFIGCLYQNYIDNTNNYIFIDNLKKNFLFDRHPIVIDSKMSIDLEYSTLNNYYKSHFFVSFQKYRNFSFCSNTLSNHTQYIKSLCQLHDGRIVSGSKDTFINIWDQNNCQLIKKLHGHIDCVNSIVQLHDKLLLSCSEDKTIILWDIINYLAVQKIQVFISSISVTLQLKTKKIVSCSKIKEIKIFSYPLFNHEYTLMGHSGCILTAFELEDGNIISGDDKGFLIIWNLQTKKMILNLKGHKLAIWHIIQLNDGRVISAGHDNRICIWDITTQKCIKKIKDHDGYVFSLLQLKDGSFASGSNDKTIKIWNENSYECLNTLKGHENCPNALIQLDDGTLVSGSDDHQIKLWK